METLKIINRHELTEDVLLDVLENLPSPTVKMEDIGIGHYEFQGAPGYDSRMEPLYESGEWEVVINFYEARRLTHCIDDIMAVMHFIDVVTEDQTRFAEGDDDEGGDCLKLMVDKKLEFYSNCTRPYALTCKFYWEEEM